MSEEKTGEARMVEILKSHGIEMRVGGCGCCDSPWVRFKYNGETILDAVDAEFDTEEWRRLPHTPPEWLEPNPSSEAAWGPNEPHVRPDGGTQMRTYQGLLSVGTWGEADDVLYLSSLDEPLAEELQWMSGKQVTARYWITDTPCSRDEATEAAMMAVMGAADVEIVSLWTDENLNVGGHDLLQELKNSAGKYLILEVDEGAEPA